MPKYNVVIEFKVRRSFKIYDAADVDEAVELALEEAQSGNDLDAVAGFGFDVVDVEEEER